MSTERGDLADAALDRLSRAMHAIAYRRAGATPWQIEKVWGDTEGVLGCTQSQLIGANAKALLTSEDVRRVEQAHDSLRVPGDMVDLVLQLRRGDGWGVAVAAHSWGVFALDGSLEAVLSHYWADTNLAGIGLDEPSRPTEFAAALPFRP